MPFSDIFIWDYQLLLAYEMNDIFILFRRSYWSYF